MSSIEEMLREAQHAFFNISPGSADEKKYAARARRLATRIIRRSPDSVEGTQARMILYRLGSTGSMTVHTNLQHEPHPEKPRDSSHTAAAHTGITLGADASDKNAIEKAMMAMSAASAEHRDNGTSDDHSWGTLWRLFCVLSDFNKRVVASVLAIVLLIIWSTPFLLVFIALILFQPGLVKKQIRNLLLALG